MEKLLKSNTGLSNKSTLALKGKSSLASSSYSCNKEDEKSLEEVEQAIKAVKARIRLAKSTKDSPIDSLDSESDLIDTETDSEDDVEIVHHASDASKTSHKVSTDKL